MDLHSKLKSGLNSLLTKMEIYLRLDSLNEYKLQEGFEELNYAYEQYFQGIFEGKCLNEDIKNFSNIYTIELAIAKLTEVYIKNNQVLDLYMRDPSMNYAMLEETKKEYYNKSLTVTSDLMSLLSNMIDVAVYNNVALLNIQSYNYFGFDKHEYKKIMEFAQYKETFSQIDNKRIYDIYTGGCTIDKDYQSDPIFKVGVINNCKEDTFEFRVHRLICILLRLDRKDLASVLCRLIDSQINIMDTKL